MAAYSEEYGWFCSYCWTPYDCEEDAHDCQFLDWAENYGYNQALLWSS